MNERSSRVRSILLSVRNLEGTIRSLSRQRSIFGSVRQYHRLCSLSRRVALVILVVGETGRTEVKREEEKKAFKKPGGLTHHMNFKINSPNPNFGFGWWCGGFILGYQ